MRIATITASGQTHTYSEISADGNTATHRDQESEFMHNLMMPFFMDRLSKQVAAMLEAKITETWELYFDDPTPRWVEVEIPNPGLMKDGKPLDVEKVIFGVGTFFHIGSADKHFALQEHSLSHVTIATTKTDTNLRLVFDRNAKPISIDFGDGRNVRPLG